MEHSKALMDIIWQHQFIFWHCLAILVLYWHCLTTMMPSLALCDKYDAFINIVWRH